MKVLVTGATGFFGGNLVRVLHARGHQVRYLARGGKTAIAAKDLPGCEVAPGDVNDAKALEKACEGVDWVFHAAALASMMEKDRAEMVKVNVTGTELLLKAAKNVKRFIHISTVDAVGYNPSGEPATEETPWNFGELHNPYPDTKKAAEEKVMASGLDFVIVNPSYMIGAYDPKPSSTRMVLEIMKGKGLFYTAGGNSFVDVLDVCEGALLAAEKGKKGERYVLAGHNLTYKEFFTRAAKTVGKRPPIARVPRAVSWCFALGAEGVAKLTGSAPMVSRGEIAFSDLPHYFSAQKAEQMLGYKMSPIEPAIARAAEWFRQNGYVR